jgi:hypothetical protein
MMRILTLVLGLAVVSAVAYRVVSGRRATGDETPRESLDNVRAAARNIEERDARQAKEALEKATPKD